MAVAIHRHLHLMVPNVEEEDGDEEEAQLRCPRRVPLPPFELRQGLSIIVYCLEGL